MLLVLTNRKHLRVLSIFHVFSYAECACVAAQVFQTSAEVSESVTDWYWIQNLNFEKEEKQNK